MSINGEWEVTKFVCPDVNSIVPILATIGPSVYDPLPEHEKDLPEGKKSSKNDSPKKPRKNFLGKLIDVGAAAFRINFSHVKKERETFTDENGEIIIRKYSHKDVKEIIERIREVENKKKIPIPIIMDLKGPEIRVLRIEDKSMNKKEMLVKEKDTIHLLQELDEKKRPSSNRGMGKLIVLTFEGIFSREIRRGSKIRIDDGRIELKVTKITNGLVTTEVITEGKIEENKSINLPGIELQSIKSITDKDKEDLQECFDVDIIAQSFVRNFVDVLQLHVLLDTIYKKSPIPRIIAKIETEKAISQEPDTIGEAGDIYLNILKHENTFGIMVARGDLGGELGIEKVPKIQERLIDYANRVGKPIIVATQMLESMRKNPVPTRAEAEDVYSALKQGADSVMLSGETANGNYPIEAVENMKKIINETEIDYNLYRSKFHEDFLHGGIGAKGALPKYAVDVVGYPLVTMANGAKSPFILTYATKAWSAARISRFRPNDPTYILALTVRPQIARVMRFLYKVCPVLLTKNDEQPKDLPRNRDEVIELFSSVIKKIVFEWIDKQSKQAVIKRLGKDWENRFFVATLANQRPEWWDVVRALMVFKL